MSGRLDDAKSTAEELMGRAERKAGEVSKTVSDTAVAARDRMEDMASDIDLTSARKAVERHTQANPLRTLLVAGAIGLVIGRFLLPRRD